jgi:hypothetical protein
MAAACSGAGTSPEESGSAQMVMVQVQPSSVEVEAEDQVSFSAAVYGTSDSRVTWRVDPALGSIDSDGKFTASATEGDVSVLAISVAEDTARAVARVRVRPRSSSSPTVRSFAAAPASIVQGQSATLSWDMSGGGTVSIAPDVGTVAGTSVVVSPTVTTTYTLSAENSAGSTTATTTITVNALGALVFADMAGPNDAQPALMPSDYAMVRRCSSSTYEGCYSLTAATSTPGNLGGRCCFGMYNNPIYGGFAFNAITAWGVIVDAGTSTSSSNTSSNTRVELRNNQQWMMRQSDGSWHKVQDTSQPGAYSYVWGNGSTCSSTEGKVNQVKYADTGTVSYRPTGGCRNAHFFPGPRGDISFMKTDVGCVLSVVQARLRVEDPSRPDDRASAKYLIHMGADYYPYTSGTIASTKPEWCSDPSNPSTCINPGSGLARFRYVTNEWRLYAYTTCTMAQLKAHPPPVNF